MEKALLLGDTGKLGRALAEAFSPDFDLCGRSASSGLDAGDPAQVRRVLEAVQPRLVLNAAALNGLDACERDPERALRLNSLLPNLVDRGLRKQLPLIRRLSQKPDKENLKP